jgi:alkylation response protein AidB-like acyl-CoA dehydrogenase
VDLRDTPAEAEFRQELRSWLARNLPPAWGTPDWVDPPDRVAFLKDWSRKLSDGGYVGITWPEEYGGRGLPITFQAIAYEELARADVPEHIGLIGIGMAGPTILARGTEEQKRTYLRPILTGEEVWCQGFSEPGSGSDLASLQTRAERDGDGWVITGQKVWSSFAHVADRCILLARTDPQAPKHKGITYFLVDMHAPGVEVRPLRQMTGASHFNEVFLTDVRIPHERVLGEVDGGWPVAMTTLANERTMMGGGSPGPGFDELVELAAASGVAAHPIVRQELAASYTRAQIMRYLGYRSRTRANLGLPPGPESSVRKLFAAWNLKHNGELALAVQRASGMLIGPDAAAEGRWQQSFLSAPSIRIAGGSDEIQRNVIAERTLGLPRDPRVDKGIPFRQLGRGRG